MIGGSRPSPAAAAAAAAPDAARRLRRAAATVGRRQREDSAGGPRRWRHAPRELVTGLARERGGRGRRHAGLGCPDRPEPGRHLASGRDSAYQRSALSTRELFLTSYRPSDALSLFARRRSGRDPRRPLPRRPRPHRPRRHRSRHQQRRRAFGGCLP
jgi:hypothetical protein